jgi:cytochrome P450 family 6
MWLQIFLIFLSVYFWFLYKFSFWKQLGFPYVSGHFPLGSGRDVGSREHLCDFFKREYERLKSDGPAFGVYFMAKPVLVPTDPELIRDIFVRNFETFHERGLTFCEKADPLSQYLFFKNGQQWKDLRAKLSPTFTSGRMKMMFPNVVRSTDRMINYLCDKTAPLEMKEVFSSLSTEVIADVAFGLEINCIGNPNNEFRKMGNVVFEPTALENMKLFFTMSFEKLSSYLGLGLNRQETIDFFMGIVRDALSYREKNKVERNDFLQLLINIGKSEEGMTFNEIAAASFGFFLAGLV